MWVELLFQAAVQSAVYVCKHGINVVRFESSSNDEQWRFQDTACDPNRVYEKRVECAVRHDRSRASRPNYLKTILCIMVATSSNE